MWTRKGCASTLRMRMSSLTCARLRTPKQGTVLEAPHHSPAKRQRLAEEFVPVIDQRPLEAAGAGAFEAGKGHAPATADAAPQPSVRARLAARFLFARLCAARPPCLLELLRCQGRLCF